MPQTGCKRFKPAFREPPRSLDFCSIPRRRHRRPTTTTPISLPAMESNEQDSGCVGLSQDHMLISFAAWDRQPIPVELIVYNTRINKTVMMEDFDVRTTEDVLNERDNVARSLASGKYDDMTVDPRLSIS